MQEAIKKPKISGKKKIKFALVAIFFFLVIIMLVSEVLLYFTGYQSSYDRMDNFTVDQAKWWACDSASGPRYVINGTTKDDSIHFKDESWYYNRLKIVNNEGYHDRDNFTEINSGSDSLKVLFAGDSFTWGASADIDSSYVDVFEHDMKKLYPSLVWNTGIPATGTNHALFTTKKFLPIQKSNYVILGFFVGNDFDDNLLPFDKLVFNPVAGCFNLYDYDNNFNPYVISKRDAYKKITGSYPMDELNIFQKILIRSRFIPFITEMKNKLMKRLDGTKKITVAKENEMTGKYLQQLNDYVKEKNAELIVLVIPSSVDVDKKTDHYLSLIKILKSASIKYLETTSLFPGSDYLKIGGNHWNNSGHRKVGHELSKYLLNYIKEKKIKTFRKN